jgi:hypothetical protein
MCFKLSVLKLNLFIIRYVVKFVNEVCYRFCKREDVCLLNGFGVEIYLYVGCSKI